MFFQNKAVFPKEVQCVRVPLRNRCRKPLCAAPPFCADRLTEQLLTKAPAAMGRVEREIQNHARIFCLVAAQHELAYRLVPQLCKIRFVRIRRFLEPEAEIRAICRALLEPLLANGRGNFRGQVRGVIEQLERHRAVFPAQARNGGILAERKLICF